MKRLLLAAVAVAALAAPASARDYWNGSGFSLDHNFHSPFDPFRRERGFYYAPRYGVTTPIPVPDGAFDTDRTDVDIPELSGERYSREQAAAARAKAVHDERVCAPVTIYTDDGIIRHHALGCRP